MKDVRARLAAWSLVPLRIAIGVGFVEHGYAKLARGPEHFAAILAAIGLPGAHALAWVTASSAAKSAAVAYAPGFAALAWA